MASHDDPVIAWTSVTRPSEEYPDDSRRFEGFWGEDEDRAQEYTRWRPHLRLVKLIEAEDHEALQKRLEVALRHIDVLSRFWMENPGWTDAANAAREFLNER